MSRTDPAPTCRRSRTGRQHGPSGGGGIPSWLWLLVILALVGGSRSGSSVGAPTAPPIRERAAQEDLGKQASALLLATDDALRSADQEVGFAQAQFGDAEANPFQKALDDAKAELRQAFLISQQLDDDKPETPDQRTRCSRRSSTAAPGRKAWSTTR